MRRPAQARRSTRRPGCRLDVPHFAYIVRCADGSLYSGYARDPVKRSAAHNAGKGARYTAGRRPVSLVYWEAFESAGDALRRERQLKRLRRAAKEALIVKSG